MVVLETIVSKNADTKAPNSEKIDSIVLIEIEMYKAINIFFLIVTGAEPD